MMGDIVSIVTACMLMYYTVNYSISDERIESKQSFKLNKKIYTCQEK